MGEPIQVGENSAQKFCALLMGGGIDYDGSNSRHTRVTGLESEAAFENDERRVAKRYMQDGVTELERRSGGA